ncbi:MAG: TetR/AcrR family transcriptional regulator [Bacteroidales bacterium]|nr:TetR/AcrR family transcriptional regulator [Bacteroidales bacterium]MBN2764466.1 TetR/AcrR family transcriptional regulator [Bacteroidales bacterium]
MSPRTEEQFEEIREERKELILQTGLELFATKGYHNVSVSDIARAADISKGLMYNYFESKEVLLSSVVQKGIKDLLEAFDRDKDGVLTKDELSYFIDFIFLSLKNNKQFWRLYFMLIMQPEIYEMVKNEYMSLKERVIKTTYAFFEERGYEDPECEILIFAAMLDGLAFQFVFADDNFQYPLEKLRDKVYKIYGLKKQ